MMQNRVLQKILKNWITVWLVLSMVALLGVVTYAAYTRLSVTKRVISTGEGAGIMFASDLLLNSTSWQIKSFTFSSTTETPSVLFNVYNYPYPKRTACAIDATIYSLTATLGKLSSTNQFVELTAEEISALSVNYKIINSSNSNETYVFGTVEEGNKTITHTFTNCSISGGGFNGNAFVLLFDISELTSETPNGYCMKLEAVPSDPEMPTLRRIVSVKYVREADSGWIGEIEKLVAGADYDAYNYVIKGEGKGKITFKWDPEYVTINEQFLHNPDVTFVVNNVQVQDNSLLTESSIPIVSGMKVLTIKVNSKNRNRYDIQFYKIDNEDPDDYTNDKVAIYLPKSTDWQSD